MCKLPRKQYGRIRVVSPGMQTDLLHNDALHQDVVDTLGYICDYASADAAALAAVPLRIDNFKVLATLLRFAVPSQGALWLADEIAKVVPRLLFHADGNVFTVGLQCLQLLLQLEVRCCAGQQHCAEPRSTQPRDSINACFKSCHNVLPRLHRIGASRAPDATAMVCSPAISSARRASTATWSASLRCA